MGSYERIVIIEALQRNGFHRNLTAASLGIARTQLWRRIKILGIDLSQLPMIRRGRPRKERMNR